MKPENVTRAALLIAEHNRIKGVAAKVRDHVKFVASDVKLMKVNIDGIAGQYNLSAERLQSVFEQTMKDIEFELEKLGVEL